MFSPKKITLYTYSLISVSIITLLFFYLTNVLTAASITQQDGQPYTIQPGDSLYKIAEDFYGDGNLWSEIQAATNRLAIEDATFIEISDPSFIRTGQKIWIPNLSSSPPTPTPTSTYTAAPTNVPTSVPSSTATATYTLTPTPTSTATATSTSTTAATATRTPTLTRTPTPTESPEITATPEPTLAPIVELSVEPSILFVSPSEGETVPTTFEVEMMATGLEVEPAGEIKEGSGHMHILVDTDFVEAGELIINDESHLHYGQGQLTTTLELEPGEHVLRLQFANGAHIALDGDQYRDEITVMVVDEGGEPSVSFVSPSEGETVPTTFEVEMMATGLEVEPAGEIKGGSGHMHILVDTDFVEAGELIINDETHLHYGQGQLTTTLELEPGEHVLRLQFANGAHIALDGDQYRDEITVTVVDEGGEPGVSFVSPSEGETVPSTFEVEMMATGLEVEPAGEIKEGSGHMHILVDTDFVEAGELIINDETHLHYGQGQLTTTLELEPGEHVLRLQFANGAHIALDGDQYRDEITVTVVDEGGEPSVSFVLPSEGETVPTTFEVEMIATGLEVEPAGEIKEGSGHMHILVDTDFVEAGELIINDESHLHYGQGQLTTTLELEPGEHVLRLQFANGAHIALEGDQYRDEITVTVVDEGGEPGVSFVSPSEGETVPSTFEVEMMATGLEVEPAGEIKEGSGHMHILVDTDFVEAGELIINDETHLHYGQGQLTTTLELEPGEHVLRLQFANGAHIALDGDQYRDEITVTVEE
ncbi:MAG: DUF4399 domain-containing protein [Chloroflexota bacterium]